MSESSWRERSGGALVKTYGAHSHAASHHATSYLDARVVAAAAWVPELGELISAGAGIAQDGRHRTLCVAATGSAGAYGPKVLSARPLLTGGQELLVVCAVPDLADEVDASLELLDRALWGEGVQAADIGVDRSRRDRELARIGVALGAIDPTVDRVRLTGRLEAWRLAVEARTAGAVVVEWVRTEPLGRRSGHRRLG